MEDQGPYEIIVHGQLTQRVDTLDDARRAAKAAKRRNPDRHVAVRDASGVSTPEDCL